MILDESGSVSPYKADIQRAFRAFLDALKNTGSRMAVSEFSTVARLPLSGAAQRSYVVVTDATIAPRSSHTSPTATTRRAARTGRTGSGWAVYFQPRRSQAIPHLTVFITDGDPNEVIKSTVSSTDYETKVPLESNEVASVTQHPGQGRGRPQRERDQGHGLAHPRRRRRGGAEQPVVAGPAHRRLRAQRVRRHRDLRHLDARRVPGGELLDLENALRQAAFALCAPSVSIRKVLDMNPRPGRADAGARIGMEHHRERQPDPAKWVLPHGRLGQLRHRDHGRERVHHLPVDADHPGPSRASRRTSKIRRASRRASCTTRPRPPARTRRPDRPNDQPLPTSPRPRAASRAPFRRNPS